MSIRKEDNQKKLIKYLRESSTWIGANDFASALHVSTRTIRNYINELNSLYSKDEEFILISKYGYKINPIYLNSKENQFTCSYNIVHETLVKLMKNNELYDFYDLCDNLYISESTLRNTLKKIDSLLSNFDLQINISKSKIHIVGLEKNKRRLLNYLISEENFNCFNTWDDIKNLFPEYTLQSFQKELEHLLMKNHLYFSDYALIYIALHITIAIDRVKKNKSISTDPFRKITQNELAKLASQGAIKSAYDIASYAIEHFSVNLPTADIVSIALVIHSNTNEINLNQMNVNELSSIIDPEYLEGIYTSLDKVKSYFYLKPFNYDFIYKFVIHVYNMLKRIQNNCVIQNPIIPNLKSQYPLIYDMALLFSLDFSKQFNIEISENEIGFIAYHFGANLEKERLEKAMLKCAFVYDEYYGFENIILDNLKKKFSSKIDFYLSIPAKRFYEISNVDLIISTTYLPEEQNKEKCILISPLLSSKDFNLIENMINKINRKKKSNELRRHFQHFIIEDLFKKEIYLNKNTDYIDLMCIELLEKNYITDDFKIDVFLRESISSTAFENFIAIPHPLSVNAKKSFLSIIQNQKSIQWGSQQVKIIMLVGVHQKDIFSFREIFNHIVSVLANPKNYKDILESSSAIDLIEKIISLSE